MFILNSSKLARIAVQIVFAISVLLSVQAQAQDQSIVGTWGGVTFQANGRWSGGTSGNCIYSGGTYTASGGRMSMTSDAYPCATGSGVAQLVLFFGSGSYSISGNTLEIHLTGGSLTVSINGTSNTVPSGPVDLYLIRSTSVSPTTPLPPPQSDQTIYTASTGRIPATAVLVSATGTFGSATLSVVLDIARVLQPTSGGCGGEICGQSDSLKELQSNSGTRAEALAGYNVYVVALVPGAALGSATPVFFVKLKAPGNWSGLQFPVAAFLENVAENSVSNQVLIEILTNNDISFLAGTEFYIGYGTSDQEMLAAGRFRGIYKAQ